MYKTKYFLVCFFILSLVSQSYFSQQYQSFRDERDGNSYKTIQIGNKIWMAENLRYQSPNSSYFAYNNEESNVPKFGYLYDWTTACKVCPSGWRLPSNAEWTELSNVLGANYKTKMMKPSAWSAEEGANNESGFSGLPGGMRDHVGNYRAMGTGAYFWSSSLSHQVYSFARELGSKAGNYASSEFGTHQGMGLSVRCIKDAGQQNNSNEENELGEEYSENEYQEPIKPSYSNDYPIKKGIKDYTISKVQECKEKQDFNYNYLEEYECDPIKPKPVKIKINIHLNDPAYSEATITLTDLKKKETTDFPIEYVEKMNDGSLHFNFNIGNQPHLFILKENKKTITWYSEWGHWTITYFYN